MVWPLANSPFLVTYYLISYPKMWHSGEAYELMYYFIIASCFVLNASGNHTRIWPHMRRDPTRCGAMKKSRVRVKPTRTRNMNFKVWILKISTTKFLSCNYTFQSNLGSQICKYHHIFWLAESFVFVYMPANFFACLL